MIRALPASFDPATVAAIDGRLDAIRAEGVRLPLVIESGSRAWGFPSPDSDYDCRFIFLRPLDDYLTPWPRRDVIETPLDGDLDVNGWDLGKALGLLLKGNAVVIEWLMSPIVYTADPDFRVEMLALAAAHVDAHRIARHYLHLGERQRQVYLADASMVKVKKLFYALRPAVALRWLRLHPGNPIPPMHFPTTLRAAAPPADILALVDDLIARKAVTRELGEAPVPAAIGAFIDAEFALASAVAPGPAKISPDAKAAAEALFRKWVRA